MGQKGAGVLFVTCQQSYGEMRERINIFRRDTERVGMLWRWEKREIVSE